MGYMILLVIVQCFVNGLYFTELNTKNVGNLLLKGKFALVLFYAPWQEECKSKIEIIESIAEYFKDQKSIFIGKGDIYNDRKLASRYHIEDFCLLKYFVKGSDVAESYTGRFTEDDIIQFIRKYSEINLTEDAFKKPLIELNEDTFDRIIKDETKTALVYFYTEWCKKCTNLALTVKNVARTFKNEPNCVISQLNGEKNYKITVGQHVGVYPTFMFYPKNNKDGEAYLPGKFDENWSEKNITKFMNVHCQTERAEDGLLDKMAGRIDELDVQARYFIQNFNRRGRAIRETVLRIQNLPPYKRSSADFYVKIMRQIIKDGESYLDKEIERIDKLLLSQILPTKQDELSKKRNILQQFRLRRKDEL